MCGGIYMIVIELGHRGVLQPRWVQKMHRGGVDFEVESGCAVDSFILQQCRQKCLIMCVKRSFGYKNDARKSSRSIPGDL